MGVASLATMSQILPTMPARGLVLALCLIAGAFLSLLIARIWRFFYLEMCIRDSFRGFSRRPTARGREKLAANAS